jgi:hypothetical protein
MVWHPQLNNDMKTIIQAVAGVLVLVSLALPCRAQSVSDLLQQLALDYEKLAAMKGTLQQMYSGYAVLTKGYDAVKDVSKGNFEVHQLFLDGLYLVSPAVRNYPRAKDVVRDQVMLVNGCREAIGLSRNPDLPPAYRSYAERVLDNLIKQSMQNLDNLTLVLTKSKLRMNDAERLSAIDGIYLEGKGQLGFLQKFSTQVRELMQLREKSERDRQFIKGIYGIK